MKVTDFEFVETPIGQMAKAIAVAHKDNRVEEPKKKYLDVEVIDMGGDQVMFKVSEGTEEKHVAVFDESLSKEENTKQWDKVKDRIRYLQQGHFKKLDEKKRLSK